MIIPDKPTLIYTADSTKPGIKTGTACWAIPHWNHGAWQPCELVLRHLTFKQAQELSQAFDSVWSAGEATGFARLQDRVLNAIKDER